MKFTKLTLVALLLALLVCAFAACGGDPVETEGGNETAGESQTEAAPATEAETELVPETDASGEHVHTIVEKIDEPTCEQRGYKREICATCEEQISVKPIDMVDHIAAEPATCTKGSLCKFCGTVMASATGHKVDAYTDIKAATNTETGYKRGNCSVCGEVVEEIIPAGITDNYDNFPTGALNADVMNANSTFGSDFSYTLKSGTAFEIAEEGNNKYIKKLGPDGNVWYKGEAFNAKKLEITFDIRVDSEPNGIKGLISLYDNFKTTSNGEGVDKEMRVLNIMKDGKIGFGINSGGILNFADYEIGKWTNIKIKLDTTTFDYEIYVDGEMMLATASDPDNAGMHLLYIRENGEMVEKKDGEGYKSATIHNGADRSPFVLNGTALTGIEFFHWTADFACSLDNLTVSFAN